MTAHQRLVVCLDGTWNQQDSSTNVLHHLNLVRTGADPSTGIVQKRYYHRGVGTGVLDGVTGGGFGFGLEQNVRDAYNWLVANYRDPAPDRPADEIYIFGFSRGAYTARSLVGFISRCGLLRRGAPVTVNQLWKDYCVLGRQREGRRSVWDTLLWQDQARIRPITELVSDPWAKPYHATDLNASERLLVQWSRRVKITYLGVYDTVGAIGWDALAIPGLTSRLALHNNMRPTTLIQQCRHALALDEHRSSFNHTPFLAFIGHDLAETERGDSAGGDGDARQQWERTRAMWWRKIEQRWFVGAHSNVGGGYEDNRLSERPLHWLLEGAIDQGLVVDPVAEGGPVTQSDQLPRDSFAEFVPPLWTMILRAKPNYRTIDPEPVAQASAKPGRGAEPAAGYSLQTVHEGLDPSVIAYWTNSRIPLPPNLHEYAVRRRREIPGSAPPAHIWIQGLGPHLALAVWASLAAAGLVAVDQLCGLVPARSVLMVSCILAFALPVVDWSESAINFRCAAGLGGPRERAFLDAIYWSRALGFVLVLIGGLHVLVALPLEGWRHGFASLGPLVWTYWPVPVLAATAALVLGRFGPKAAWITLLLGPSVLALGVCLLLGAGWISCLLFPAECERAADPLASLGQPLPGQLLLLELSIAYLWRALLWTAEPMTKANLGSVVPLQRCAKPAGVAACLEAWRKKLENRWLDEDPVKGPAACRMRELLRVCLWRDLIGLIPVYSVVFLLGLWFAFQLSERPAFPFRTRALGELLAWWWVVPLVAAVADYLEDACHLHLCALHERGKLSQNERRSSARLVAIVLFSWSMSRLKDAALVLAAIATLGALVGGAWEVSRELGDWRAKVAVLIAGLTLAFLLTLALARIGRALVQWTTGARRPRSSA